MTNLDIYCVSNISHSKLEELNLNLVGVGTEKFSKKYINCETGINIQSKEKYYSELTFHYWFWKNKLNEYTENKWIGFCQKRRFWVKNNSKEVKNFTDLKKNLLLSIPNDWEKYDAILCKPIYVSPAKKIKILKRGWKNLLKDPKILYDSKKHNIKLQFDMFHGYGILSDAIKLLPKNYKEKFEKFVNNETKFNPHIMMISKKEILNHWFQDLFEWLFKCEEKFGFEKLIGYDKQRLYAFLAERYLSFWFNEFYSVKTCPWVFYDIIND